MQKYILILSVFSFYLYADSALLQQALKEKLRPIPSSKTQLLHLVDDPENPLTQAKIDLGKMLYFDPRLSKSNLISCNTCHNLAMGGVDGVGAAVGHRWQPNPQHLHSPTVYNAAFYIFQFWDGRSLHLSDQAKGPLQAPFEMGSTPDEIEQKLASIEGYRTYFDAAFGMDTPITFENTAQAIAAFEKTLVTRSRFDDFLEGNIDALTQKEKEGLRVFLKKRCSNCHQDVAMGGMMKYFVMKKFTYKDIGTFSGNANNLVKVPTLRNITKTAPYFHNGSVWDLKEAVLEMARIQLKLKITDEEAQSIVDFLHALEGDIPQMSYPMLPR